MTLFLDLRATAVGGVVADEPQAWVDGNKPVNAPDFATQVAGRDLVLVTHGFNVDRQGGIDALSMWAERCQLPPLCLIIGVLWPGDSKLHVLIDYVYEGKEAIASGRLLAAYLTKNAAAAKSVSFVSHSLGARTMLETVQGMALKPRRIVLMAGAIEDDCLSREYATAAARAVEIVVLSSRSDDVLQWAFPAGNLVGEIIMRGHPYDRRALGREGPATPLPSGLNVSAWQIPDLWKYGHGDYLPKGRIGAAFALPVEAPLPSTLVPIDAGDPSIDDWKPAWSASVVATGSA